MFLKVVIYRNVTLTYLKTQKDITGLKQKHAKAWECPLMRGKLNIFRTKRCSPCLNLCSLPLEFLNALFYYACAKSHNYSIPFPNMNIILISQLCVLKVFYS